MKDKKYEEAGIIDFSKKRMEVIDRNNKRQNKYNIVYNFSYPPQLEFEDIYNHCWWGSEVKNKKMYHVNKNNKKDIEDIV